MFDEIKKSLEKNLSDKLVSPFWGAFISSWCAWNWKALYSTFFIDSKLLFQKYGLLKIDYILNNYPPNNFLAIIYILFPPLIASYVIVFWLPKLTKMYYSKALDYEYENKIVKEKKDKSFLLEKGEKLNVEKDVLVKEREIDVIKSEKSQEDIWDGEYVKFEKTKYFDDFNVIIDSIYKHSGRTEWDYDFNGVPMHFVPADIKAYSDANDLIKISMDKNNNEFIQLTDKGKYFIKNRAGTNK